MTAQTALGGGFAAYGIYPEYRDFYAFHIFIDTRDTRKTCEALLKEGFEIVKAEHIPIRQIPEITDVPLIWRYFLTPLRSVLSRLQLDEAEYVARTVTRINVELTARMFFQAERIWARSRRWAIRRMWAGSTGWRNTPPIPGPLTGAIPPTPPAGGAARIPSGCWTGRWSTNGEISSYDANRRCVEMFGYRCTLQTDTEVMTYIADYLLRRQGLTLEEAACVMAAPFWSTIGR